MPLNFSERNSLAHRLGAYVENGYWRFPSMAKKQQFLREVYGLEWQSRVVADAALKQKAEEIRRKE